MSGRQTLALAAAIAVSCLCVAVVYHQSQGSRSELMQNMPSLGERRAALQELAAKRSSPMLAAVENAYAKGFAEGEGAVAAHEHAPALAKAAMNWKASMIAKLRTQQEEERTLDARKEVRAERNVALALNAEEASEPRAYKEWQSMGMAHGEQLSAKRMSLAMDAAKKLEPAARKQYLSAMKSEEASEPRAYEAWRSMGGGNQEALAAKRMSLAMAAANKMEPAAYRKMQAAMKAEESGEAKAYKAWESMGGNNAEARAAQRMSLAMIAADEEEPAARKQYLSAKKAEEASEPRAYEAWRSMGGGNQEALAATRMSLAQRAEEQSEPAAFERFETSHTERTRRAMAESRVAAMHQAMQRGYEQLSMQRLDNQKEAINEAAKLYKFCSGEFPAAEGLRKFCFEKLSSPPQQQLESSRPVEFTGNSLQAAIERAHASGLEGMPKYAVYHTANGQEEAFRLVPVRLGGEVPSDAVGFVNMPEEEHRPAQLAQSTEVHVDGASLEGAIDRAHAMGLKGEPKYVVFHPAHGAPEVFKLMGREQ